MLKARFEDRGNTGTLHVTTHFGKDVCIECSKEDHQTFKLGGTGINEISVFEGIVLQLPAENTPAQFRAFRSEKDFFEDEGEISTETFNRGDGCFVIEYYPIDVEGKRPGWILCKNPIDSKYPIFINLYVMDGGGNTVKTYRVSPFFGTWRVMNGS
jgi:hypothetical protein